MTTPTELAGRKARTHEANRLTADDRTAQALEEQDR